MIRPYKQTILNGCLASCLLMIGENNNFTKEDEENIITKGSKRTYPFYVIGIPIEYSTQYYKQVTIWADNKYFTDVLNKTCSKQNNIHAEYAKITLPFIAEKLAQHPLICHIDDTILGDYSHASHFVILENINGKYITIIDPWVGKRKKITTSKLLKGIELLRKQIKMCPLLYAVG